MHIHLRCSWTTRSPVILEDLKPNSHWLQLITTNPRTGHRHLPKRHDPKIATYALICPTKSFISLLLVYKANYSPPPWMKEPMVVTPKPRAGSHQHKWPWDQSPRCTGFAGPSHHAQETPVNEVICLHIVFSVIPVLQQSTHVLNLTPAKLPTAGIKKTWDALQNNTLGA